MLGDLPPEELGVTDSHDHLFLASAQLPGQELDDPAAAEAELRAFTALGGRSVVQWTPHGMGGRPGDLAELSRRTGVHLVAATGLHRAMHYADRDALRRLDPAELFTAELRSHAGLVKVAGAYHGLDAHARWTMAGAAEAHRATGAPIAVHHELGTAAEDVLELLCGDLGVPPHRVILGHLNRFPDLGLHRRLAASGAYLALDGPSAANHATDHHLLDCLAALADAGHADRLLLGGDTTTAAARGNPGMAYLLRRIRPRLGPDLAHRVFTANPAVAFAVPWTPRRTDDPAPDSGASW
ncbi:phosphotriesterase [Kitasatospora sp. NPDC059571]|uniref:phosphotriesterase family protein n=1 Tax=Kitasatospora sp. NPDC059571 TaxID=3346871 RepID=UPI0036C4FDEB